MIFSAGASGTARIITRVTERWGVGGIESMRASYSFAGSHLNVRVSWSSREFSGAITLQCSKEPVKEIRVRKTSAFSFVMGAKPQPSRERCVIKGWLPRNIETSAGVTSVCAYAQAS